MGSGLSGGSGRTWAGRVVPPVGVVIPVGVDPVMADLIAEVNTPDHEAWLGQVARVGACAHPLHLRGFTRVRNRVSGAVEREFSSADAPGGVVLVRCGNRRAAICPSCAYVYQGDVYHLVRAGLEGGKGIPGSVAGHPRVFATLTAPGFGAVHSLRGGTGKGGADGSGRPCHPRRTGVCAHGRATGCLVRHGDGDLLVGTPLCADCYDYPGAVIWQASVGTLWRRFVTYLPRFLATVTGRSRKDVAATVRFSFVKIVEYQRRGLVHVHAVIRADGITTDDSEDDGEQSGVIGAPDWVTAEVLGHAVVAAAEAVRVRVGGGPAGSWVLGWGPELDVHDITALGKGQSASKVAAYVAKYATKSTEVTGWNPNGREDEPRAVHTAAMARAAFALAEVPELGGLKLGRWVKELSYRGHVSSKSRSYSTTLGALRQARADHRREAAQVAAGRMGNGPEPGSSGGDLVVESSWELVGFGYTPGQQVIAADVARDRALNRDVGREAVADEDYLGGGL
jgi:hypothetical protein